MLDGYGKERLALFGPLLRKRPLLLSGNPWTVEPAKFRFKLGETFAELKVPYHLGKEDEQCIERAIQGLLGLLKERHEKAVGASMLDQQDDQQPDFQKKPTLSLKGPGAKTESENEPLPERTYRTNIFPEGSAEKLLVTKMITTTPLIDTSILKIWLDPNGSGKKFFDWVLKLMEKALVEEATHGEGEMTAYLALMAILNSIKKKKECIKGFWIKGVSYERLDISTGYALHQTVKTAIETLFTQIKAQSGIKTAPATETLLKSAIAPHAFLLIPSNLLSSSLNPYWLRNDVSEILSPILGEVTSWPDDLKALNRKVSDAVNSNAELRDRLESMYFANGLRERIIEYLMEFDVTGGADYTTFYNLYKEDRQRHLKDGRAITSLMDQVNTLLKRFERDPKRTEKLKELLSFINSLKGCLVEKKVDSSRFIEASIPRIVESFITLKLDAHVDRFVNASSGTMLDRRLKYSADLLVDEFKNGRLYRFATDSRPILKALAIEKEGQLMVDMKDFTKKTLKFKEIAMSEFMKDHYYDPILVAAKKFSAAAGLHGGGQGITLKNLPGDAAIFSGGTTNLIELAKEIRLITRRYREEIKKKFVPMLDKHIENFRKKYQVEKDRQSKDAPDLEESLIALSDEEDLITSVSRDELEADITEDLECGLFISYGTKAETMIIDAKEGFSNDIKVAIGEKINEAARGTARNAAIFAKIENRYERERAARRTKELKYPFDVYIDKIYTIKIPLGLEESVEEEIDDRAKADHSDIVRTVSEEYQNDLEKLRLGMPVSSLKVLDVTTDIYNRGEAISHDAFNAYMIETKARKIYFKKNIMAKELHESIRENYFLPSDTIELWIGAELKEGSRQIEIFHRAGEISFKGFEASPPTVVYEILDPEGDFFKDLIKHHYTAWIEDARREQGH